MAQVNKTWNPKLIVLVAMAILNGVYQLVTPYLEKTKKMQVEVQKVSDSIRQLKSDSELYNSDWEKLITEKEAKISESLPDSIVPSEVLRYFATQFEKSNPSVEFTSLIPSAPTQSAFIINKQSPPLKIRISKLQIKAKMPTDLLFSYLEHVEKYPGLLRVQEVSFASGGESKNKGLLALDMNIELFLTPKDWLPKSDAKGSSITDREVSAVNESESGSWFSGAGKGPSQLKEPKEHIPDYPKFRVHQLVGTSIVVGEQLYEEGERVDGWLISKIDRKAKTVWLKKGSDTFKVVIP